MGGRMWTDKVWFMVWVAVNGEMRSKNSGCSSLHSESCWLFETFIMFEEYKKLWLLGKRVPFY